MTINDPVATALRTVIDSDARSVVVPPVAVIQRRSRRRRQTMLTGTVVVVAAAFAVGFAVDQHRPGQAGTVAAGGTAAGAAVEVREVLDVRAPALDGALLTSAVPYTDAAYASSGCAQPTSIPDGSVAPVSGEAIACDVNGNMVLHLAPAQVPDADVTGATADGATLTFHVSPDGAQHLRRLTEAAVNKMIAFVVNGVVVSSPTVQTPSDHAVLTLQTATDASKIADAINTGRG